MKKSLPYELAAVFFGLLGAVLLVAVYLPIINPPIYQSWTGVAQEPVSFYVTWTPVPLAVIAISWFFNRKARSLKGGKCRCRSINKLHRLQPEHAIRGPRMQLCRIVLVRSESHPMRSMHVNMQVKRHTGFF